MNRDKLLDRILSGASDANIRFDELCGLLRSLGFAERHKGSSHHIFTYEGVIEILNLQPLRDGHAKPYQVKQVRNLLLKYRIISV
jgi:hypothetical protein